MSLARRHAVLEMRALSVESPDRLDARLDGPGSPGWNCDAPLAENLRMMFGGEPADAVWWYKPLGSKDAEPVRGPKRRDGALAVMCFNEAWWLNDAAAKEVRASGTDLVVCHHQADMSRFSGKIGEADLRHIPHAASRELFVRYAKPWQDRSVACLVTGALDEKIYPLRTRLARLVESGRIPGEVRPHPGYRLGDFAALESQEIEYAKALGNAKIALLCSSVYRYGLAKYPEAAMAGCLVAGDVPVDFAAWGTSAVILSPNMTDAELCSVVGKALYDMFADERAAALQRQAIQRHTMRHYVEALLAAIARSIGRRKVAPTLADAD